MYSFNNLLRSHHTTPRHVPHTNTTTSFYFAYLPAWPFKHVKPGFSTKRTSESQLGLCPSPLNLAFFCQAFPAAHNEIILKARSQYQHHATTTFSNSVPFNTTSGAKTELLCSPTMHANPKPEGSSQTAMNITTSKEP